MHSIYALYIHICRFLTEAWIEMTLEAYNARTAAVASSRKRGLKSTQTGKHENGASGSLPHGSVD